MLVQLASASSFTLAHDSSCRLAERGLVAFCPIGRGEARLVADADWIDDRLWTADPADPGNARLWTSDAIPILSQLLRRQPTLAVTGWTWLTDGESLVWGLRWSLLLAGLMALASAAARPFPIFSRAHDPAKPHFGDIEVRPEPDST
jgi:hypothetical protein